ncbi:MAG: AAA family ATPase [Candidatus Cloacimonetes bacterium]|nr:AAA family ATPase [Candidatus Cloacimonadota bacterium]
MAKNLYIAATAKDVGKSTVSFALLNYLITRNKKVSFMKPVGQRWLDSPWGKVEEDVILMKKVFQFQEAATEMNPVVIRRGFTEEYLSSEKKTDLSTTISDAYCKVSQDKDYVIIEGTGHAGVGSVIDQSNADVASLLDAKVVLLAKGGIGSTIDELELNYKFFKSKNADVIGIILNKVLLSKKEKVERAIKSYCKSRNLELFGLIPFSPTLRNPTLGQIIEELKPTIIKETDERNLVVDDFLVVASTVNEFVNYFKSIKGNQLLIMPTTRMDITFSIPLLKSVMDMADKRVFTILFSGLRPPSQTIIKSLEGEHINILWRKGDTFTLISKLAQISIKTRSENSSKIDEIKHLVNDNINFDSLFSTL